MHIAPGHLRARLSLAAATLFLLPLSLAAQAPGRTNTLTDVAGIKVGHYQRVGDGYQTGTTVVRTEQGATAGIDVQGGAPGTRESDLLAPGGLVTQAHAIVLSGGSAYGLDSATGVMRWLEEHGHGFSIAGGGRAHRPSCDPLRPGSRRRFFQASGCGIRLPGGGGRE